MSKEMIFIASDHAGFKLKESVKNFLKKGSYIVKDLGPYRYNENDDYPDYAFKVSKEVLKTKGKGILVCSSGQGMAMAANKLRGIMAAVVHSADEVRLSRLHNDSNILCLGSKFISAKKAQDIIAVWLKTKFDNEKRHVRRIKKVKVFK